MQNVLIQQAPPAAESRTWTEIARASPSGVASVAFTDLSAYRYLRITAYLLPASDSVVVQVRDSVDNGSSYRSTSGDYHIQALSASSTTVTAARVTTGTNMQINANSIGNVAGEGLAFTLTIYDFNQAKPAFAFIQAADVDTAGAICFTNVSGKFTGTTARDALSLFFSTGNIASGQIILEGAV